MKPHTGLTLAQTNQIALAILALPDSDEKASLVQVTVCNLILSQPFDFDAFRFIQACYVKHSVRAQEIIDQQNQTLEDIADREFMKCSR